jgi:phage repressor protein C with HTH and peptisase S24 domain
MIVKGDSMEPKFEGGDEIALKEVHSTIEWGKAYVLATRDGVVLKRLFPAEHGFRCVSYNHEEYPDFIVDEDDVFGKYRVVGLIRV